MDDKHGLFSRRTVLGRNRLNMLDAKAIGPDIDNEESLHVDRCADCHLADASGSDEDLAAWGEHCFNDGASLATVLKMSS